MKRTLKRKLPIFVVLPLIAIVLLGIFHLFQYRGYKAFVGEYLCAMETGNTEEIIELYNWEYVEARNERIIKEHSRFPAIQDPTLFTSETLEDYVYNNDKYYRFLTGEKIDSWKITKTSKNFLSLFTPRMEIEVYIVFSGRTQDVIARMEMERGNDGWYMTEVYAYYASDEAED